MNKLQLQNFASNLIGKNIDIYIKDLFIPEYQGNFKPLQNDIEIELNTIYGISIDGYIEFEFKTGKKIDNILKTFVTQYINKFEVKQWIWSDVENKMLRPNKKDVIKKLKNSNRVAKYFFYTTIYGIGYFCYFMNDKTQKETNLLLKNYLDSLKISFKNEFSEAGWVYRFVINKDVKIHNNLLNNFNI